MNPSNTQPHIARADSVEVLAGDPTGTITLLADAHETGGAITCNRSFMQDGSRGAPAHFHTVCSETFFVLSGSLDLLVGEEVIRLGAGDLATVPAGVHHAFAPTAGHDVDILVLFAPGVERFDYYRLLDRVHSGSAHVQEITDSQDRYDNHYVESSAWNERAPR